MYKQLSKELKNIKELAGKISKNTSKNKEYNLFNSASGLVEVINYFEEEIKYHDVDKFIFQVYGGDNNEN